MTKEQLEGKIIRFGNNEEENNKVQQYLLSIGFRWISSGEEMIRISNMSVKAKDGILSLGCRGSDITSEEIMKLIKPIETLEEKKERLQKELAELDKLIEESQDIQVGDYVIFQSDARGWSFPEENVGCIGLVEDISFTDIVREGIKKCKRPSGSVLNPNNRAYRKFSVPVYKRKDGGWTLRKATPQEVEVYRASAPEERTYKLGSGKDLTITNKRVTDYRGNTYPISDIRTLFNRLSGTPQDSFGFHYHAVEVVDMTVHIGCKADGTDITLNEIGEILSIAELLK